MYRSFSSLYSLCEDNTAGQTDNRKFLPLNARVYAGQYSLTPIKITRNPDDYPENHPFSGEASGGRYSYRFYDTQPVPSELGQAKRKGYSRDLGYQDVIGDKLTGESYSPVGCASCGTQSKKKLNDQESSLYPLLDPRFNLREAGKQLILLEDHLNHTKKRCIDCIKKHSLFIEGLMEEAIALDKEGKFIKMTNMLLKDFKRIQKEFAMGSRNKNQDDDAFYCGIAQKLRNIRKPIVNHEEISYFGC